MAKPPITQKMTPLTEALKKREIDWTEGLLKFYSTKDGELGTQVPSLCRKVLELQAALKAMEIERDNAMLRTVAVEEELVGLRQENKDLKTAENEFGVREMRRALDG